MTNTVWTEKDLYAYLDGELALQERRALEEDLADNVELRRELKDLRCTLALFRDVPLREAPRNYLLTSSMVEDKERTAEQRPHRRWLFATRLAATLSALVFVIAMGMQLNLTELPVAAPAPEAMTTMAVEEQRSVERAEIPEMDAAQAATPEETDETVAVLAATPTSAALEESREMPQGEAPSWGDEGPPGMGGGLGGGETFEAEEAEKTAEEESVGICVPDAEEPCDAADPTQAATTTTAAPEMPLPADETMTQEGTPENEVQDEAPPPPADPTSATRQRSILGRDPWLILAIVSGLGAAGFALTAWWLAKKR